uniref:Nif11 domain-containing protein n=1 Tax=Cyanothece sp. (strain PCC 7425 / ATCC 29141) TaxID=395961 RepID=B8HM22_CYAP4
MAESLEQFRQQVLQDPMLAEQFKAVQNPDEFATLAVQLGQQLGYNFTVEEVKAAIAQSSSSAAVELSDSLLEAIAGGSNYTDNCALTNPTCENQCN